MGSYAITVVNHITFNASIGTLQWLLIGGKPRQYLAFYAPLTALCILLDEYNAIVMPLLALAAFVFTRRIQPSRRARIFGSTGGVFIILVFDLFLGNLLALLAPTFFGSAGYNYLMAGANLLLAALGVLLFTRLRRRYTINYLASKPFFLLPTIEIAVIFLYSYLLDLFHISNDVLFAFATMLLALLLMALLVLYAHNLFLHTTLQGSRAMQRALNEKAMEGAKAQHFVLRVLHEIGPFVAAQDMPGLRAHLQRSNTATEIPLKGEMHMFDKVDDPALQTTLRALSLRFNAEGIIFSVIEGPTAPLPPAIRENVCNIVEQLGSNAIAHLKTLPVEKRRASIGCLSSQNLTQVEICNLVGDNFELQTVSAPLEHHPHETPLHGLQIISNLAHGTKGVIDVSCFMSFQRHARRDSLLHYHGDALGVNVYINSKNPGYGGNTDALRKFNVF